MLDQAPFLKKPLPISTETPAITASEESVALATATPINLAPQATQEKPPYAYVFYATQDSYACSVLVNIQRLQDVLHTEHRIFVLASHDVSPEYITLFEQRNVTVSMQTPPELADGSSWYYKGCLLKLFAFKMHLIDSTLKKVIALDSDQLVLQNLDHLFESSIDVDLAAPRAYWIAKEAISSTFLLIQLSDRLWHMVEEAIRTVTLNNYDMDLVNQLLGDTVMMLPGQFITPNSHWEDWNLPKWFHATNGTPAASVLHFFGLGKPWTYRLEDVEILRPGAHPLFLKQFRLWRETARNVCPSGPWDTL
ncbi:alphaN-acetylglucosamine transferase [Delphinella strobiligena]|nr:alphaN-acetylglucosamine transferase [Delphinella strobiligena]